MKNERLNTITWIALTLLTVSGFLISDYSSSFGILSILLILGFTLAKYLAVGFQFLELKHAHLAWRIIFSVVVLAFLLVIFFLQASVKS